MSISLLQWNSNSLTAHLPEFKHYLDELSSLPQIICVQETFLRPTSNISFPGYSVFRQDGLNGRGGVAILVKNEINYSDIHYYKGVEGISVTIETIHGPLQIFNFYVSPTNTFDETFFQEIFSVDNSFICGDFNAKSSLWGSPKADQRGKSIENILKKSNMVVLNTGEPTRYHRSGFSHIDL